MNRSSSRSSLRLWWRNRCRGRWRRWRSASVKLGSADDAAFIMKNAQKVIIVPGYACSGAGPARLAGDGRPAQEGGRRVKYAIHPVAGRMPGHMNVLLAEANVPYDEVFELEDIIRNSPRPTSPS